jgi:hypothetical protein
VLEYGLYHPGTAVRCPAGEKELYLLQNVQTGYGAHLASCSLRTEGGGALSPDLKRPECEAETHLDLTPSLNMSEAM